MKLRILLLTLCCLLTTGTAYASGYGVFTQGASGLGQANAVVAHPTGPSSLYFNPALINDVPGRQVEVGTTAVTSARDIDYAGGGSENGDRAWNFPSNFYYTHQGSDKFSAGLGIFFPFGLSNEWDKGYDGRFIGTSAKMFTMNINPAFSYRVTDRLSLAAGLDFIYVDTELKAMVNQSVTGLFLPPAFGGPIAESLPDIEQKFDGEGWGSGFNLGALFKATDRISIGAAYRSQVDVDIDGDMSFGGVDPRLALLFREGEAESTIKLPAQFVAGVALQATDDLIVEVGTRWEDWDVNDKQTLDLQNTFLGQPSIVIDRNWHSTWAYNIGANYQLNEKIALNLGYLYGENAVPNKAIEPIIPDSDVHLFTIGTDLTCDAWTLSAAFGYEYHDSRTKNNAVGDPLGSQLAGMPVATANGEYDTDIYLLGLSVGYKF
jgi:long-chain fatty acid transport protein